MASAVSFDAKFIACAVSSNSSASAIDTEKDWLSSRFEIDSWTGGRAASRARAPSRSLARSSAGTTRFTRPMRSASAASMMSAKNTSSFALCRPTSRGSNHEPPKSTLRPRFEKISEKRARVGGHDEVAAQRDVQARAGGDAVDRGDRRAAAAGAAARQHGRRRASAGRSSRSRRSLRRGPGCRPG